MNSLQQQHGPEQPVSFHNREGLKLFGILHRHFHSQDAPGIILLCPGVKNRVAPQRLYVKMARRFCALGFPALRFDFSGIGDSEGEVAEEFAADFYGTVQAGRYVDDTLAAMDWMEEHTGIRSFILAGLCGGAITGLLAGSRDRRVCGLLALGIPVIMSGRSFDPSRYITRGQLDRLRGGYLSKVGDASSWIRFLTFRSDYRKIVKSLCGPVLHRGKGIEQLPDKKTGEGNGGNTADGNINPLFRPALEQMLQTGRRVIFIFSGSDRLQWEFEEKFAAGCNLAQWGQRFQKFTIPYANHVLSFSEWQEDMFGIACDWLEPYAGTATEAHARAQHSL